MVQNLLLGMLTMALCLLVQCFVVSVMLRVLYRLEQKTQILRRTLGMSTVLLVVMLIMLTGNLVQITMWAGLFMEVGEFTNFETAFYHSVVNFSTLGYGDIVMSTEHRLLGALEATNGVLMFGLTASMIFLILSTILSKRWEHRHENYNAKMDQKTARSEL